MLLNSSILSPLRLRYLNLMTTWESPELPRDRQEVTGWVSKEDGQSLGLLPPVCCPPAPTGLRSHLQASGRGVQDCGMSLFSSRMLPSVWHRYTAVVQTHGMVGAA